MEFFFEKLVVYQNALSLVESLDVVADSVKGRFPSSRKDQLTRASMSVPLNIAEGAGRRTPKEKGHFYVIARGSAYECAAVLQILKKKQIIPLEQFEKVGEELGHVVRMLSGLIRHVEAKLLLVKQEKT